jgi:hypothetical protein
MYRCPSCRKTQTAGSKQVKVVTQTRERTYQNTIRRGKTTKVIESKGSEIVKEVGVCQNCADKLKKSA